MGPSIAETFSSDELANGVAASDRAGDAVPLVVSELVVMFAAVAELNPAVPLLAAHAGGLELVEQLSQDPTPLGLLVVGPFGRRP